MHKAFAQPLSQRERDAAEDERGGISSGHAENIRMTVAAMRSAIRDCSPGQEKQSLLRKQAE